MQFLCLPFSKRFSVLQYDWTAVWCLFAGVFCGFMVPLQVLLGAAAFLGPAVETWQTSCGADWSYQSINWTDWHGLGRWVRSTVDRSGWLAVDLCSGFGSPSMLSIDILSCSFGILLFGSSSRCYGLFYSFTIISFLQMTYQAT